MKKKIVALMLATAMTAGLCACGSSSKTTETTTTTTTDASADTKEETATEETAAATEETVGTEVVTATTEETTEAAEVVHYAYDTPASSTFTIDPDECVKSLPDYSAIPITLDAEYEITLDNENAQLYEILDYYGYDSTVEVTDHDTVQDGDWVNVDYTGYLDGEAFDGGSATGQLIDVDANASVSGSGYIDGFTDALKGAKVGEEVSGNVTFPEDYSSEDLAGKEVTFKFVVNSIVKQITFADLTDEEVANGIGADYGFDTVGDLKEAIDSLISNNAYTDESNTVTDYLVENSEVDVPEDYLEARLNEYIAKQANSYCADDQTFEEYVTNYGYTLDSIKESWREGLKQSIASELILQVIAEKEGITMDEDDFETRIASMVSYYGYGSADDLYSEYGAGDVEYGKLYMQQVYIEQLALDKLIASAVITYTSDDTEAVEEATEAVEEATEAVTEQ